MKLFYQFILVLLLGLAAHLLLSWWWVLAPVAFLTGLVIYHPGSARVFLMGFLAGALLWWGMAFYLSSVNDHLLAGRMGQLFGDLPPLALSLITGLIGGLLGGMSILTANLGRGMFRKEAK
jgi:hypothetical protein